MPIVPLFPTVWYKSTGIYVPSYNGIWPVLYDTVCEHTFLIEKQDLVKHKNMSSERYPFTFRA